MSRIRPKEQMWLRYSGADATLCDPEVDRGGADLSDVNEMLVRPEDRSVLRRASGAVERASCGG